jgi:hypothetical protein
VTGGYVEIITQHPRGFLKDHGLSSRLRQPYDRCPCCRLAATPKSAESGLVATVPRRIRLHACEARSLQASFHHLKTVWIWEIGRIARCDRAIASSVHLIASWAAFGWCVTWAERILPYGAGEVPCFLNTASIAAWAHFSPSALDTPIEPIISPSTTIGKAPGCGKSCMKVGTRFWPLRTILFISEVGRRQRSADFAFSSAVSMELAAAPSMA